MIRHLITRYPVGAATLALVTVLAVTLSRIPFALLALSAATGSALTWHLARRTRDAGRDAYRAAIAARDTEIARLRDAVVSVRSERTTEDASERDTLTRDAARLRAMVTARDMEIARLRVSERSARDAAERWNAEYAKLRGEIDDAWDAASSVPAASDMEDGSRDGKRDKLVSDPLSGARRLIGGEAHGDESATE
jgi:hypothetical protein